MPNVIKLKRNNRPKKAGYYLCQRNKEHRPEVAEVREKEAGGPGGLYMLCGISIFSLEKCEKDALWSDEISFV